MDHYVEIPFDLSQVLFITTANSAPDIPAPLYDRMDVIELQSYTAEEKFTIARAHLREKTAGAKRAESLGSSRFTDGALRELIDGYTREAGVRSLERQHRLDLPQGGADALPPARKEAVTVRTAEPLLGPRKFKPDALSLQDEVGVVNGLAWTSVGGEMLPRRGGSAGGNRQDRTDRLARRRDEGIGAACGELCTLPRGGAGTFPLIFTRRRDIHIHAPEGAVPKDGPSAGVTMATALVSALTGIAGARRCRDDGRDLAASDGCCRSAACGKNPWRRIPIM